MGKNPDAVPPMIGANVGRSQHAPLRIEPERGQVSENSSESPRSEGWGVLHERPSRLNFAKYPLVLGPKPRRGPVNAGALACD